MRQMPAASAERNFASVMIRVRTASCSISAIWQAIWKACVDVGVRGFEPEHAG